MTITENLDAFLDDFGVSCTAGAVTALGILDMPSQVLLSDAILSTDYTLGICTHTQNLQQAQFLADLLSGPASEAVRRQGGFEF